MKVVGAMISGLGNVNISSLIPPMSMGTRY